MIRTAVAIALVSIVAAGCGSPVRDADTAQVQRFDYQLGGAYDPADGLDVVVRDSTASPLPGAYSICYVNGFQTQPGQGASWSDDLLLHDSDGLPVIDPEWPDEFVLDPTDADKRARIDAAVGPVIDRCAAAGFAAVEIDNLDTWTRFPGVVDEDSILNMATLYAVRAHASGMEIAQKNAPDGAARIRDEVGFDFAIAEECAAYDECSSYTAAYGSRVYDIEYTDNLARSFEDLCAGDRPAVTIVRDRNSVTPADPDYEYRQCS